MSLPLRPEKDGNATSVNTVCTHRPDPTGRGVDREQLYWELSQLTRGITKLGPYTLDQDSLYINGEQQPCLFCCMAKPLFFPYTCFILFLFLLHTQHLPPLFPSPSAGYTYHTSETTPSGEYRVVFRSRYVTRDARTSPAFREGRGRGHSLGSHCNKTKLGVTSVLSAGHREVAAKCWLGGWMEESQLTIELE